MLGARNHNHFTRHNVQFFEPDRIRNDVYKNLYGVNTEPEGKEPEKVQISGLSTIIHGNEKKRRSKYQK
jgi:hypothetical protein